MPTTLNQPGTKISALLRKACEMPSVFLVIDYYQKLVVGVFSCKHLAELQKAFLEDQGIFVKVEEKYLDEVTYGS